MGLWVPISQVQIDEAESAAHASTAAAVARGQVVVNGVRQEVTPGMLREQHAHRVMDFLEERLVRDFLSPTSFKQFCYLGHTFRPWYYSPVEELYDQFHPRHEELHDAFVCPFSLTFYSSAEEMRRGIVSYYADHLRPPRG
jgi:hypothetical protein